MSSAGAVPKRSYNKYWCHSFEEEVTIDYTWVIDNFENCKEENGEDLKSSIFPIEEELGKWHLLLYPKGESKDDVDFVSIFLTWKPTVQQKIKIKASLSVVDGKGSNRRSIGTFVETFHKDNDTVGYSDILKKEDVFNPRSGLLINGKLMINCQLSLYSERVNVQTQKILVEDAAYKLSMDFGEMLDSENLSDIILCVEGKEIKAHKNILSARSKVFAAMFAHSMRENHDNRVEIPDLSFEVLSEMLLYMYTGKSPNLKKMPEDLLVASDKYDLPGLKQKCEGNLINSLSFDNAIDILILADKHSVSLLKSQAIGFVKLFPQDVMNGPGWLAILNYPKLLEEICRSLLPTAEDIKVVDTSVPESK